MITDEMVEKTCAQYVGGQRYLDGLLPTIRVQMRTDMRRALEVYEALRPKMVLAAYARVVKVAASPVDPTEYDLDLVAGDLPPNDDPAWFPLYAEQPK